VTTTQRNQTASRACKGKDKERRIVKIILLVVRITMVDLTRNPNCAPICSLMPAALKKVSVNSSMTKSPEQPEETRREFSRLWKIGRELTSTMMR
jgi:hypothetical protein